jgi:hypothetical protein
LKLSIAVPALAWPRQITGPDITEDPDCPPFPRDGGWRGAAGPSGPFWPIGRTPCSGDFRSLWRRHTGGKLIAPTSRTDPASG